MPAGASRSGGECHLDAPGSLDPTHVGFFPVGGFAIVALAVF